MEELGQALLHQSLRRLQGQEQSSIHQFINMISAISII
jgi:hypothetical protein